MSGLIEMWSTEKAKMEEKGQTLFSKGSVPSGDVSVEDVKGKDWSSTGFSSAVLGKIMRTSSPLAIRSEASVFMVVLCTP